jgi:hypothetical protein
MDVLGFPEMVRDEKERRGGRWRDVLPLMGKQSISSVTGPA